MIGLCIELGRLSGSFVAEHGGFCLVIAVGFFGWWIGGK